MATPHSIPRVLVVDDHPRVRQSVAAFIAQAGYDVRQAADGFQAKRVLTQFVPDVVVLDVMRPYPPVSQLVRHWRGGQVGAALIVLTASGDKQAASHSPPRN
jgi:DNA-binding response OmpR family regulator